MRQLTLTNDQFDVLYDILEDTVEYLESDLITTIDENGNEEWRQFLSSLNLFDIIQTNDGGYMFIGSRTLVKVDENGENELTGDHIIAGLIYRLMVPITDEDMIDSLNTAEDILNGDDSDDDYDSEDDIEYAIPDERRPLKVNNCPCEICTKCRECISKYDSYETYDLLTTRFKDSIKETCEKHNIYIN